MEEKTVIEDCIHNLFADCDESLQDKCISLLRSADILFQEDLKLFTRNDLCEAVKLPTCAAKKMQRAGLLMLDPSPGSNLLTMQEYLQQTLRFRFAPFGVQPGPQGQERSLDHVGLWDILPEIGTFVESQDNVHEKYPADEEKSFDDSYDITVQGEFRSVVRKVGRRYVNSDLKVIACRESPPMLDATGLVLSLAPSSNGICGLVVSVMERDILGIEMKGPAVFRASVDDACENLVDVFTELSLLDSPDSQREALVEPLYDIYTYMTNMNLGYGILSSLDVSYFVRRVVGPMGDALEISEGIPFDSSKFLGAVAYVLSLAFLDQRDFNQRAAGM